MLTRNFDNYIAGIMTIQPDISSPTEDHWRGGVPGAVKNTNGAIRIMNNYGFSTYSLFGNSNTHDNYATYPTPGTVTHSALLVGSGTDDETYHDYKFEVISNLNVVGNRSVSIAYTADACKYTTVKTFINNTDADVTVNELGLFWHYSSGLDYLLYRKKLGQPVTLKANGGTATFKLEVDIPYNKP